MKNTIHLYSNKKIEDVNYCKNSCVSCEDCYLKNICLASEMPSIWESV